MPHLRKHDVPLLPQSWTCPQLGVRIIVPTSFPTASHAQQAQAYVNQLVDIYEVEETDIVD